uniref:Uncharacterized protein n=1 Tax=Seriola dumerili TaxID=41447 RepID=A0A3B4VQY4_SERDU
MQVATGSHSVTLQPWLVGLTAVVVFLLILFTILVVHRFLKKNRSATHTRAHTHTHTHRLSDEKTVLNFTL